MEPTKGKRKNTLMACVTDEEFAKISSEALERGFSRSSLVYLLIVKATDGFTDFDISSLQEAGIPASVGARAVYKERRKKREGVPA